MSLKMFYSPLLHVSGHGNIISIFCWNSFCRNCPSLKSCADPWTKYFCLSVKGCMGWLYASFLCFSQTTFIGMWSYFLFVLRSSILRKISSMEAGNSKEKINGRYIYLQGVPKKTLSCLWRLITLVWKQLLGQVGTVLESSGYQLSFETKKSRIILKHLWEKRVWSWLPYHKTWQYCITDIHCQ